MLFIFCLSGFASLVYEVIWVKSLTLIFGTTTIATAIVVSSFMAGLGLGSVFWGKKVDRSTRPAIVFGFLEIGIGLSSLLVSFIVFHLDDFYRNLYHTLNAGTNISVVALFILTFLILFIPTFFMGGTFPAISKIYVETSDMVGKGIGRLYAVNTAGGIAGTILAGFILIKYIGMSLSIFCAVLINIIIGLWIVFAAARSHAPSNGPASPEIKKGKPSFEAATDLMLACAFLTGFAGLAYEILWFRAVSIFLANSTYTFSVVLAIYLLGITVGSIIFIKFLNRIQSLFSVLAMTLTITGAYSIFIARFMNRTPQLLFVITGLMEIPLLRVVMPGFIIASVIMLIPTIMMGISFPLVIKIYSRRMATLGRDVGLVYFLNTVGSIVGPLAASFIFIPLVGVIKGIIIVALLNLLVGITMQARETVKLVRKKMVLIQSFVIVACVLLSIFSMRETMLLPPSLLRTRTRADRILYYRETLDGTVIATEDRYTGIRACYVNNSAVIGTTYDAMKVVKMLGFLPFLLNPMAKHGLIIGFGVGITTASLARNEIEKIDCIEICPGVKEAAKFFSAYNDQVFRNVKVDFKSGDGRNFLLLTENSYDIISCDPTHPTLGSGNLYTKEYFQFCKKHLSEHGVFCQYLPLHKLSPEEFRILICTFAAVFPHAMIWLAHSHAIMVGTMETAKISFSALQAFAASRIDDILTDPYLLSVSLILDEDGIKRFCQGMHELNTDDRPILEYFSPGSLKKENWQANINQLMDCRSDPVNSFYEINAEEQELLKKYLIGQEYFIQGLVYMNQGDQKKMYEEFNKAAAKNPENGEIKKFMHLPP